MSERQTVGEYLEQWLKDSARPTVRPRTFETYRAHVRGHLAPDLGKVPLAKLTPQHVQTFLTSKRTNGLSARSVGLLRATLRRALNQAVRWGEVPRNVAALVDLPQGPLPEIQPLTIEQTRTLLDAVRGDRLEALYLLAVTLGLRRGEVLGVRWLDLDLDTGTLTVRVALQRVGGRLTLTEPKTVRSRRTLGLAPTVVAALKARRKQQLEERVAAGPQWRETGLVFTTGIGTPLDPSDLGRHFRQMLEKAKLPRKRFHDLRHGAATALLAADVSPRVVMEILGHSAIGTTMNIYAHVVEEAKRTAVTKMEAVLGLG